MNENLLSLEFRDVELLHVRMAFSTTSRDIGRFQVLKLWHLVATIAKIVCIRIKYKPDALYYPPAGRNLVPMYRDIIILCTTRWLFKQTIFHFHAGGISELYDTLPRLIKCLYRRAYFSPNTSIILSRLNPPDDQFIESKASFVVPNGIHCVRDFKSEDKPDHHGINILHVGLLCESKGVLVLLRSLATLASENVRFQACFVGNFQSRQFQDTCEAFVESNNLQERVEFKGALTGRDKWREFHRADIFCFPTFYEAETFGLVVLEAMQYNLAIIASSWRGVPDLIEHEETGLLVEPRSSDELTHALRKLSQDRALMSKLGQNAHSRFTEKFTIDKFRENMQDVFDQLS
ncbi:hypothetical protein GCM10008090_14580 [Arenicella chitinivorans]|uniref:Glycosyl transferase family 1 domain-containing protein n=2 Tax=Arenicella chitinivorans TaxID=1329800 RepID=A0A918VJ92_9GAMM|nr:hypothetical protein GCM10008090_14580 [Arenicella chitinivorans]